jgi:hypothetical protein
VSKGWGSLWAVGRFFVQRATVTLQNNEHDDTEHQQQCIRSHHDHLLRRSLHPLPLPHHYLSPLDTSSVVQAPYNAFAARNLAGRIACAGGWPPKRRPREHGTSGFSFCRLRKFILRKKRLPRSPRVIRRGPVVSHSCLLPSFIVRNVSMRNNRPLSPTRSWQRKSATTCEFNGQSDRDSNRQSRQQKKDGETRYQKCVFGRDKNCFPPASATDQACGYLPGR